MIKKLQIGSVQRADSLFSDMGVGSRTNETKQTVRLDVGRAEKALLRRARKQDAELEPERVRRGPLERMFKIHQVIADGRCVNAMQLAAELEIGHKTICRDIDYMRDHYALPIEYDAVRHGYYYSKQVNGFPGASALTEKEMFAWLVANKAIEQYRGTPFHPLLATAFKKMLAQLDSKERFSVEDFAEALSFRPFAPEDADLELFEMVTRARRERKVLEFVYRNAGEKDAIVRRVHPYHVMCSDNRWYFLGHDELRADIRTFALARMGKAQVLAERFTRPNRFDAANYFRDSLGMMKGDGDYEVVIDFDAFATDQLRGRKWHSSQEITEMPGGGCRLRMRLSGLEEVERWVLSWGIRATVVGPSVLIERIGEMVRQLASRYVSEEH